MNTADLIRSAAAGTSGNDAGAGQDSESSSVAHASESTEGAEWGLQETADNSTEQPSTDSSDTGVETEAAAPDAAKVETKGTPDKEFITVSDDKGKRKVEVDYSNRDAIKKAFAMAHGARKWQSERDSARQELTSLRNEVAELKGTYSKLEEAFASGGEAALIDLIADKPGAHKEFAQKVTERERLAEKDPEAYRQMLRDERLEKMERELERERTARAKDREEISSKQEAAEIAKLESTVHPTFDKYRFDGKLGDADAEQIFDEMLWNTAMKRLVPYEQAGTLSKQIIDQQFREASGLVRKHMGQQVEKKVAKVVEQKKQEATQNAQAATVSGYKTGGVREEAEQLLNKGDLTSLFRGWGKYGKAFK